MYLTTANAEDYIGKKLDSKRRILGIYPYTVIRGKNGELLTVDRLGVASPVPKENDLFNAVRFDIVNGIEIESEEEQ